MLLESTPMYAELCEVADTYVENYAFDEEGNWVPDPDLLFEPPHFGSPSPMALKESAATNALDSIFERYLG